MSWTESAVKPQLVFAVEMSCVEDQWEQGISGGESALQSP